MVLDAPQHEDDAGHHREGHGVGEVSEGRSDVQGLAGAIPAYMYTYNVRIYMVHGTTERLSQL